MTKSIMTALKEFAEVPCECGREHKLTLSDVIIEKGAIQQLPRVIESLGTKKVFVLADENTYAAAGERVCELLSDSGIKYSKYILQGKSIEPDEFAVGAAIMGYDSSCDLILGVGSGVINDIGKILANTAGKPYVIFGTAPSMDGYASATSSMSVSGLKVSLPSKQADVIIADTDILKAAPYVMLQAGLGDMLAKYIAICEWKLAHVIVGEYYCPRIAALVMSALQKCVDNAQGLLKRDETAVRSVFEGLVICGIAMSFAGCSRPASGVEHYFSHVWDMRGLAFGTPVSLHGIQCAIGTRLALERYEQLKEVKPDKEKALKYAADFDFSAWSQTLREFIGKGAEAMIALEAKEHKYDVERHKKRLDVIIENWDKILENVNALPTEKEFTEILDAIEAPKTVEAIGLDSSDVPLTFAATKDIRDKYVLSRLFWDIGLL